MVIAIYGCHDIEGVIRYVGFTRDLRSRFKNHYSEREWCVGIKVLEWASKATYIKKERKWIASFPKGQLENKYPGGNGAYKRTAESIQKGRETRKRNGKILPPVSEETRRLISLAGIGRKHSKATKKKMSMSHKGRAKSDETKRKLSVIGKGKVGVLNNFYGRHHTEETKEKIRQAIQNWICRGRK